MTQANPSEPFLFEILRNALNSLVDEMALTIFRTAYSSVLKDNMDYSTALCDAEGKMVAQGLTLASHLGSIPDAIEATLRHFGDEVAPGDVYCMNDPFDGGMHLPDVFAFRPIYAGETLVAWAATVCHHTDVGGRVPGSNASDSTEIYQEGLRIPPLKLYERGVANRTLLQIIEKNVRLPARVMGDLRAQLSALHVAEEAMGALIAKHGAAAVTGGMRELIDYSERLTRAEIAALPRGEYSFEDWIDDDGVDYGVPIPIRVKVSTRDDRIVVDWTGSGPQVKGAINSTLSFTKAATYTCIKSVLRGDIPNNEGFFRCIDVIAPSGAIVNAVLPAACAARGLTGFRMVDCCFGALAQMLPDRVFAASEGGNTGVTIGGYTPDRRPFIHVEFLCSAWGGRPWADGLSGNSNLFGNLSSTSAEVTENESPIAIDRFEFVQDSGGPGRFRGGMSVRRSYRLLEDEAILQVRADRFRFRPYGLNGGSPGRPGRNFLNPASAHPEDLPGKLTRAMRRGDVFLHEQPGPGGWGDPLERDPEAVLRDVRNEYVSLASAENDYGVVIDTAKWSVDVTATVERREEIRRHRCLD